MRLTLFLFFLLVVVSACRQLVQDEFPDMEPVPVVNALLQPGETALIELSQAGKLEPGALPWIDNASVLLLDESSSPIPLQFVGEGKYTSEVVLEAGIRYTCRVEGKNFSVLEAEDRIPNRPRLLKMNHIENAWKDEEGVTNPAVALTFQNPLGEEAYFEVLIHLFPENEEERLAEIKNINDPVLIHEGLPFALFGNSSMPDTTYTLLVNYTTNSSFSDGGPFKAQLYPLEVELRRVSKHYYEYRKSLYLYEQGRYPQVIGGVVSSFNLYSNIQSGYGIFASYSSVRSERIYPNPITP